MTSTSTPRTPASFNNHVETGAHRITTRRRALVGALSLVLSGSALLLPMQAFAAQTTAGQHAYHIASGKLSTALDKLAVESGVQLAYAPRLVDGKTSPGLSGTFSTTEALNHTLRGTGLAAKSVGKSAYVIQPKRATRETRQPRSTPQPQSQGSSNDDPSKNPATTQTNPTQLQGITVSGIRQSLADSLAIKRGANTIVEAVSAEDLGKFPNTNVAEAMTQIPGVTLDRNMGQGDLVSINGTDPALNLTFINGHLMAEVPWLHGSQPSRGFDFTILPPQLVGNIEVHKTSEARFPDGSVGGTIFVHTRKPLDLKANTVAGSIGVTNNSQAHDHATNPIGSLFYSWKNTADTFGFDVSVSHYKERIDREGLEIFNGYSPASDYAANLPWLAHSSDSVPTVINSAWFRQTRERNGAHLTVQWKPTDRLEFSGNAMYVDENYDNWNTSFYPMPSANPGNADAMGAATNGVITSGHLCSTVFSNPCQNGATVSGPATTYFDSFPRKSDVTIKGFDLAGAYRGDGWGVKVQGGISKSSNPDQRQYAMNAAFHGGYSWDLDKGITFDDPAAARDPQNWTVGGLDGSNPTQLLTHDTRQLTDFVQADFHNDFDGAFYKLQYGVRYNQNRLAQTSHTFNAVGPSAQGTLEDIVGTDGYVNIIGNKVPGFAAGSGQHLMWSESGEFASFGNYDLVDDPSSYLNGTFNFDEKNIAAYVQQDFALDRLSGNFGLRYVHTKTTTGSILLGADKAAFPIPQSWWHYGSSSYSEWLPSVNLTYSLLDDLLVRGAISETIARPPAFQEVNSFFIADVAVPPKASAGNADLKPYKSTNIDASVEWYFAPQSVFAVSAFYKNIRNYISTVSVFEQHFDPKATGDTLATLMSMGLCDANAMCKFSVTKPANVGTGKLLGLNLSYQQSFGESGFGMVNSVTYSHGTLSTGGALPYNSKWSANISPYFAKGPFSARLTMNWRDAYLAGGYIAGAPPATTGDYTELDLSLGWTFNKHYSITLDALNLTDQRYIQYFGGNKAMPANRYYNGKRYLAKFNFKF
ncbi:MAG TPA: TonB-dependent receptor [Rhodanobacteraceae bacterium]